MARKRKGLPINGIVLLNKEAGLSSNSALQKVRRLYQAQKAGHTGSLDPFATGLLPVCLGEATKVSGLLLNSEKRYIATLKLGEATDSGDNDGEVIAQASIPNLTNQSIEQVLSGFVGEQQQIPPMYSALKHQGKPLYEYARQGIEIERAPRPITIYELKLLSFDKDEIRFEVFCSKGTYVRTLGEDIAKKLGTLGHLIGLHRTQIGDIQAEQMHLLNDIEAQPEACLLPIDFALQHLQAVCLDAENTQLIQHGGQIQFEQPETELVRFYNENNDCFGVGEWLADKQLLKPKRLFNL